MNKATELASMNLLAHFEMDKYYRPVNPRILLLKLEQYLGFPVSSILKAENEGDCSMTDWFNVAHKLGHLMLHFKLDLESKELMVKYPKISVKENEEADEFALALLMPAHSFLFMVKSLMRGTNVCNVDNLSNYYNASHTSIAKRLSSLKSKLTLGGN